MASIKDIARRSGTSPATVSRVINGSGYVSEASRARVQEAIAELGFLPNAGARRLRSGESRMVGVLLPALDVPFFAILAHVIEQALFQAGYQALICCTDESAAAEERYISTLLSQGVDGVIAASVLADGDQYGRLAGVPVVALDRDLPGLAAVKVGADHHAGGRLMAGHLLDQGHSRIAVIGAPAHSAPIQARLAGALERLAEAGHSPVAVALGPVHDFDACRALAEDVLETSPTALIGTTDIAAIGAIHAAIGRGLRVPADLAVIGFDDLPAAAYVLPALTTISQPLREIAAAATAQLIGLMTGAPLPPPAPFALRLVRRETT
ncbi:LacI family DNA-binding transcriptional regulator [Stagnihabitans tardus]|uniref:Substrate-binding domain-containing protein n=1 Tax=Stagnihabitans tardus TaxID=2699202 RepID=A0AAE5BTM4_9RHOB|nr:LacI family DNA-binding transcriptional regulator [Stagnihabitans tardus]NBZ86347.1 substrate-binding domain-containing protein [Stagnihabitans tardus]